jgi:hypothetical protein
MTAISRDKFEKFLRSAGQGLVLDFARSINFKKQLLQTIRRKLREADRLAQKRWGDNAPRLTLEAIIEEFENNPQKVVALLETVNYVESPSIILMAWRIMRGMEISKVEMRYRLGKSFSLEVWLSSPRTGAISDRSAIPKLSKECYKSTDFSDVAALQRFGILKIDNKPLFNGYHAWGYQAITEY